jgi:hypothetical protein
MGRTTDDTVSGIIGRWAAGFDRLDAKTLATPRTFPDIPYPFR